PTTRGTRSRAEGNNRMARLEPWPRLGPQWNGWLVGKKLHVPAATPVDHTAARNGNSRIALGVSVLSTLGIWVCARRSIAPRRARVQRRGRPISDKALVILQCNEAFENGIVPVERAS